MPKLLIHPAVEPQRLQRILEVADRMQVVNASGEADAQREIVEAEAFFGKLTPPLLAAARQLKWVQSPTASLEHYVFEQLVEHPLVLTNMRGLFSDVIADQVLGYVICFARNLHIYIRRQMAAQWAPEGGEQERISFASGPGLVTEIDRRHQHLSDLTLGVVGLGGIGSEIARRARAFSLRVIAVDAQPRPTAADVAAVWHIDYLDRLLQESDYVVIAAPHTPKTYKMFRRAQFRTMKPTAYLINIGRGAIVDLADLHQALVASEIAGAALDVFEQEPLPPAHPLWQLPNVILTPHVAGYSPRIAERHLNVLLENIRRFQSGQPLMNVVDKREWY